MLIILITLCTVVVPGVAAGIFAYRWPQAALTAPKISVQKVESETRRHPRLAAFTQSRLDPGSATGLLLTRALLVFVVGSALVAVVLVMIRTNTGFAGVVSSARFFGAQHAACLWTAFL